MDMIPKLFIIMRVVLMGALRIGYRKTATFAPSLSFHFLSVCMWPVTLGLPEGVPGNGNGARAQTVRIDLESSRATTRMMKCSSLFEFVVGFVGILYSDATKSNYVGRSLYVPSPTSPPATNVLQQSSVPLLPIRHVGACEESLSFYRLGFHVRSFICKAVRPYCVVFRFRSCLCTWP